MLLCIFRSLPLLELPGWFVGAGSDDSELVFQFGSIHTTWVVVVATWMVLECSCHFHKWSNSVYRTRWSIHSAGVTTVFSCSFYVTCVRVCNTSALFALVQHPIPTVPVSLCFWRNAHPSVVAGRPVASSLPPRVPIPALPRATQHAVPFRAEITALPATNPTAAYFPSYLWSEFPPMAQKVIEDILSTP